MPSGVATLLAIRRPTLLKVKKGGVDHTLRKEQGCRLCEIILSSEQFGRRWEQWRSTRVGVTTYVLQGESLLSVGYEDSQYSSNVYLHILSSEG